MWVSGGRSALMKKVKIFALAAAFCLLGRAPLIAQDCERLGAASPEGLVGYLSRVVPDRENASCVAFAISQLGGQRHEPAIPVLLKFLTFRWPLNARQKQRLYVIEHDGFTIYPAANALERIGKNALPAVLGAIKAKTTSREGIEVAVAVWMTIHQNQAAGLALLKQEADKTKNDPETKQRLGWAAFKALGWCSP